MLINLSNHPSDQWSEEQTEAAKGYGEIVDLPFPAVDAVGDESYVANLAESYLRKVLDFAQGCSVVVHLMGEMTLTHALVVRLQRHDITCIASTSERVSEEVCGVKTSCFQFVRFRRYE